MSFRLVERVFFTFFTVCRHASVTTNPWVDKCADCSAIKFDTFTSVTVIYDYYIDFEKKQNKTKQNKKQNKTKKQNKKQNKKTKQNKKHMFTLKVSHCLLSQNLNYYFFHKSSAPFLSVSKFGYLGSLINTTTDSTTEKITRTAT